MRHPLMAGLLLTLWATPHMGAAHLSNSLALSCYIWVGIRFEERDLRRAFGTASAEYASAVPALLPRLTRRR